MSDKYYTLLIHKSRFQKSKVCFKYTLFLSTCIILLMMILCVVNNHGLKYQQKHNLKNNIQTNQTNQTKNSEIQSTTVSTNKVSNVINQKHFDFSKEDFDHPPIDFEDVIISNKTVFIEGGIVSVYN